MRWWWVPWGSFYNVGSCLLVWRVLWSTYWINELGKSKMVDLLYPQSKILFDYNFLFIEFTITKNYFKFNLSHTLGLEITKSSLLNLLIEGFPIIPRASPNFLKRNFLYLIDFFMTKSINIQYLCTVGT